MKLYFWLHVCSTAWGLRNFAIAFYSVPNLVFDFVWHLISSDEIPAMRWLGYGTCLWRVWAATRCVCLFPFFLAESRPVWDVPLSNAGHTVSMGYTAAKELCPRYQHEQMFKQWFDFCWSTILAKPWLSSALTWGPSHSFSKELQHLKVIALLPRVAEVAREREQDLGVIHTHFIKVQWQPSHQRKELEGDPWTSRWKCCGLLKFCAPCFADRSGTSAWGEVTKS